MRLDSFESKIQTLWWHGRKRLSLGPSLGQPKGIRPLVFLIAFSHLFAKIEIKMRLSIPSTISKAQSVKKAVHISGLEIHSM